MLQIILAVIGISIVSTMGFIMLEQLSLQNQMQVQRENIRRLDVAADGLVGALGRLPGVDTLVPPVPGTSGSAGWSVLPDDVGAVNSTVTGIPFLYCPVATLSAEELESVASRSVASVQMPGSNYATEVSGRYVVSSALAVDASLQTAFRPVAFIIAPGARSETPPDCDDIRVQNNVAVVDGGIVRVVSMPSGVASVGTGADAAAEFWVSSNGSGNGQSASAPTSINAALTHFVRYSPDTMTIHLMDSVSPSGTVWSRFAAASADSGSKLRLIGSGSGRLDVGTIGGVWNIPSSTFFENVTVKGPRVVVGRGDSLFTVGTVGFLPHGNPTVTVEVLEGGRFQASDSIVSFANQGQYGIRTAGDLDLRNSSLRSGTGQLSNFIWLDDGGELNLVASQIGASTDRPIHSSILSDGSMEIISDANSTSYASSSSNGCWAWNGADIAFKWSAMGVGSRSAVRPESEFPAPAPDADATTLQNYQNGVNERYRARRVNASNIYCG